VECLEYRAQWKNTSNEGVLFLLLSIRPLLFFSDLKISNFYLAGLVRGGTFRNKKIFLKVVV
jgi:hypothetical protein